MQNARNKHIAGLQPHPDQQLYDGTLAEADEHALREDLRVNGQRDPIKILADGTIVDGHQRVRLLEELGHAEVLAIEVELDGDEYQQRADFLRHNMSRRQLCPLRHASLELRAFEADNGWEVGEANNPRRWSDVKDAVRARLQGSDRHVNRVLRVVLLPSPVITAVEQGRLSMTVAEKLDKLEPDDLAAVVEEIEEALAAGTNDINPIAKAYLPETQTKCNPDRDFEKLCESLEAFGRNHGEHIGKMTARRFLKYLVRLLPGKAMLDRLVAQLQTINTDTVVDADDGNDTNPFGEQAEMLEDGDD